MDMNDLNILIYGLILIAVIGALLLPIFAFVFSGRLSDAENGLTRVEGAVAKSVRKTKTDESERASKKLRYTYPMP